MDLIEKTLVEYINEVDSLKSAPGGGSVAGDADGAGDLAGALHVRAALLAAR